MCVPATRHITTNRLHRNQALTQYDTRFSLQLKFRQTGTLGFSKALYLFQSKTQVSFGLFRHLRDQCMPFLIAQNDFTRPVIKV